MTLPKTRFGWIARLPGIWPVFLRYCDGRIAMTASGAAVRGPHGQQIGQIERIALANGRLCVEGWARAGQVTLTLGDTRAVTVPSIPRSDVARALPGGASDVGFVIEIPFHALRGTIRFDHGNDAVLMPFQPFAPRRIALARARHMPGFLMRLARVLPDLPAAIRGDGIARARVKTGMDLAQPETSGTLDPGLLLPADPAPVLPKSTAITIIVPVFNALDLLPEMLGRVLRNTDVDWYLILVEDCSTDAKVRPFLREWVAEQEADSPGQITLIENATNLGFIGSVNRAFARALTRDGPVVPLNSDAFVPPGWASRLVRPILAGHNVASVTPMSKMPKSSRRRQSAPHGTFNPARSTA